MVNIPRGRTVSRLSRHILPIGLGVICCWVLLHQLRGMDLAALWGAVTSVAPWRWGLAATFTALSFAAVARYDVIAHRHLQLSFPQTAAMRAGATAVALGQTLGAGVVVGAFVRWRMQPALGLTNAAKVSAFVAVTFLGALAVVVALAALVLPTPQIPAFLPPAILSLAFVMTVLAFIFPVLRLFGRDINLPTLPALAALLALCLADTIFAALALFMLLPPDLSLSFAGLLPIFLISLGAAILSGTPGGVGPFELAMLALLPTLPAPELMAAILAFRAVYYALPALLGGAVLLRDLSRAPTGETTDATPFMPLETMTGTARAELGVIRQNGGALWRCETGACGIVRTGQTLTALFDPVDGQSGALARPLRHAARAQNRIVCKYKITARQAVQARRAGWATLRIADEALLAPTAHSLKGSAFRQLRRKLRQAETAGILIRRAQSLPLPQMAAVSAAWEARHGVPRGVTMGRFDGAYLRTQAVFLAYDGPRLLGFVSFHTAPREWCLDLMRALPDAHDGTMHALVHHAIRAAATDAVPRLSLAAAPALPTGSLPERHLRALAHRYGNGPGLRQFKSCFAPRWQPLYMAAPGPAQLTLAAIDLIRAVRLRAPPATPVALPAQLEPGS